MTLKISPGQQPNIDTAQMQGIAANVFGIEDTFTDRTSFTGSVFLGEEYVGKAFPTSVGDERLSLARDLVSVLRPLLLDEQAVDVQQYVPLEGQDPETGNFIHHHEGSAVVLLRRLSGETPRTQSRDFLGQLAVVQARAHDEMHNPQVDHNDLSSQV